MVLLRFKHTAVATTTRCTSKIEDPSLGPGRIDFGAPDGEFRLKGAPEPEIRMDPSPNYWNLVYGPPLYKGARPGPKLLLKSDKAKKPASQRPVGPRSWDWSDP